MVGWPRSEDRARLHPISLQSGNLTGNFAILRHLETVLVRETTVPQPLIEQFPTEANREIISRNRDFQSNNNEFCLQICKSASARGRLAKTGATKETFLVFRGRPLREPLAVL
jgi:hypothetical protein